MRRLVLGDGLAMEAHALSHQALEGTIRDVMYVSRGLMAFGQKEIALDIRLRPSEAEELFDVEIGHLFLQFLALARTGRFVDVGGQTTLASESRPLLGRADFLAIVYTAPDAESRALLGGDGIQAIIVTGPEAALANEVGHHRLLGQLGRRSRYFPTPPWSDRDRPEVLDPDFRAKSLLRGASRVPAYRSTAWIEFSGNSTPVAGPAGLPDFESDLDSICIHLHFDPASLAMLREAFRAISESLPLIILTGLDPAIARALTWVPGQVGGNAISDFERRDDRRCSGNFVLVVPEQPQNRATVNEDGFGLTIRTADWIRVRAALIAGQPMTLADDEGRVVLDIDFAV